MRHDSLTTQLKEELYSLQAGECYSCKTVMRGPKSWSKKARSHERKNQYRKVKQKLKQPENLATFEHVIPIRCGGNKAVGNVLLACRKCNLAKGASLPSKEDIQFLRKINFEMGLQNYKIVDEQVGSMFKWLIEMGYVKT